MTRGAKGAPIGESNSKQAIYIAQEGLHRGANFILRRLVNISNLLQ